MSPINTTMTAREWTILLVLSVLWGGSFFFVEVAVAHVPPLTLVTLRVGLAALALWAVLLATGRRVPARAAVWAAFLGMGVLNNAIPFSLFVWGQAHIASGLAAILNATTPLFTVLVAAAVLPDEPLTRRRLLGVVLGLAGVVVLVGGEALAGLAGNVPAQLACLAAAVSYACAGAFGRRFRRMGVAPLQTAAGQVTASSLVLAPLALALEQPWTLAVPPLPVMAAVAGLAVLSTAVAYILYFRLLATAGATNLLLVTFLIPVSAMLLGVTILGETVEVRHLLGMAGIALGLAAVDGRLPALLFRTRTRTRISGGPA